MNAYNEILQSGGTLPAEKNWSLHWWSSRKGDLKKAQAILERIWSGRDQLENDELRAEVLFWIAEGEHAIGKKDKALKHYLELAWEFPNKISGPWPQCIALPWFMNTKDSSKQPSGSWKQSLKRADRKAQKKKLLRPDLTPSIPSWPKSELEKKLVFRFNWNSGS